METIVIKESDLIRFRELEWKLYELHLKDHFISNNKLIKNDLNIEGINPKDYKKKCDWIIGKMKEILLDISENDVVSYYPTKIIHRLVSVVTTARSRDIETVYKNFSVDMIFRNSEYIEISECTDSSEFFIRLFFNVKENTLDQNPDQITILGEFDLKDGKPGDIRTSMIWRDKDWYLHNLRENLIHSTDVNYKYYNSSQFNKN